MQGRRSNLKGHMTNLTSETPNFFAKPINLRGFREVPQPDTRNKRQLQERNRVTPLSKMLGEFLNNRKNTSLLKCSGFQGRFANLLQKIPDFIKGRINITKYGLEPFSEYLQDRGKINSFAHSPGRWFTQFFKL